jgi:hypothetical protein
MEEKETESQFAMRFLFVKLIGYNKVPFWIEYWLTFSFR